MKTRRIVFLEGCEPDGLTAEKLNALLRYADSEVHLVYWERKGSDISMPFHVDLPSLNIHPISETKGVLFNRVLTRLRVMRRARHMLRALQPDLIQVSTFDMLLSVILPGRLSTNIVFDLRDTSDWMLRWPATWLLRRMLRSVQMIMVTSPRFETEFLRRRQLIDPQTPVTWVPNVPESRLFNDFQPCSEGGGLVLGYVGTFRGKRSLRLFSEGIAESRRRGSEIRGVFAGTGIDLPLVKRLCAENGFLSYIGAYSYLRDIRSIYERVNVVYAVYDDSHNKRTALACRLAEAILCGIPTIVMAQTYMAEIVTEKEVGVVLPRLEKNSLAGVLCRLAVDGALRRRIYVNCGRIAGEYTFEHFRAAFLSSYDRLGINTHG